VDRRSKAVSAISDVGRGRDEHGESDRGDRIATSAVTHERCGTDVMLEAVVLDDERVVRIGEVDSGDETSAAVAHLVLQHRRPEALFLEQASEEPFGHTLGSGCPLCSSAHGDAEGTSAGAAPRG
jgi:hypothetical protein